MRWPRRRVAWFWLGIAALVVAVATPVAAYDDDLFSAHMVQHMLLKLVAPSLLLLAAPVTLVLRFARPHVRTRWLLPALHSKALQFVLFPPFTWLAFVVTLWATHFTPIYDAAIEDLWVHRLERILYVGTALLFWWPIMHADPGPYTNWRGWAMSPSRWRRTSF